MCPCHGCLASSMPHACKLNDAAATAGQRSSWRATPGSAAATKFVMFRLFCCVLTPFTALTAFACRSKIIVARNPQTALQPLAHHLHGIQNVPVAWGGKCSLPYDQYPGHRQLLQLVAKLNAES